MKVYSITPWHIEQDYWAHSPDSLTVYSDDREVRVNTGILDVQGRPIVYYEKPNPIGFNRG